MIDMNDTEDGLYFYIFHNFTESQHQNTNLYSKSWKDLKNVSLYFPLHITLFTNGISIYLKIFASVSLF